MNRPRPTGRSPRVPPHLALERFSFLDDDHDAGNLITHAEGRGGAVQPRGDVVDREAGPGRRGGHGPGRCRAVGSGGGDRAALPRWPARSRPWRPWCPRTSGRPRRRCRRSRPCATTRCARSCRCWASRMRWRGPGRTAHSHGGTSPAHAVQAMGHGPSADAPRDPRRFGVEDAATRGARLRQAAPGRSRPRSVRGACAGAAARRPEPREVFAPSASGRTRRSGAPRCRFAIQSRRAGETARFWWAGHAAFANVCPCCIRDLPKCSVSPTR